MMAHVIQIHGLAIGGGPQGYVKEYTPDGHGGRGDLVITAKLEDAKRYDDAAAALREWKRTSRTHPVRPGDGKPNRPLTAFTVEIQEA
jgi:hypothetical protein